jgi:hypothetical protein
VETVTDLPQDQTPLTGTPKSAGKSLVAGRRKFIVGAAPFVVTLASRPALSAVCSASAAASFNANHSSGDPLSGQTCAMGPSCWTARANHEGTNAWLGTAYDPLDLFRAAAIFGNANLVNGSGSNNRWFLSPSSPTLGTALGGGVSVNFFRSAGGGTTITATNGGSFVAEAVAALLNASFDATYPNGFGLTVAQVIAAVQAVWNDTSNADLTAVDAAVNPPRATFASTHIGSAPCDV